MFQFLDVIIWIYGLYLLIINFAVSEVESTVLHDGKMFQVNTLPYFRTHIFHANCVCFIYILSH